MPAASAQFGLLVSLHLPLRLSSSAAGVPPLSAMRERRTKNNDSLWPASEDWLPAGDPREKNSETPVADARTAVVN
jgi:hypothetical protein